jgi:hypothetical protein
VVGLVVDEFEAAWGAAGCERLMSVPGIGPIIARAIVAVSALEMRSAKAATTSLARLVPKWISTGDPGTESNYVTAQAQYQQVIGVPAPPRLAPAAPVDRLSPRTLDGAIARGRTEHALITTATYNVDIAVQQVKVAEALYPTLSAVGNVQKTYGSTASLSVLETLSESVGAQLSVPIYQGGSEYSTIRQAKETLGQRRLDLDTARD